MQIWLDVSETETNGLKTGIQRAVQSIAGECLKLANSDLQICTWNNGILSGNSRHHSLSTRNEIPDRSHEMKVRSEKEPGSETQRKLAQRLETLPKCKSQVHQSGFLPSRTAGSNSHEIYPDYFLCLDSFWSRGREFPAYLNRLKGQEVRVGILIYDILPISHPKFFNPLFALTFTQKLKRLVDVADDIFTISQASSEAIQQMLERYGIEKPVHIVRLGADGLKPSRAERELKTRDSSGDRLRLLCVGTVEPRKNLDFLLSWWRLEGWQDYELTVIGRPGWKTKWLQSEMERESLAGRGFTWIKSASDETLLDEITCHDVGILASSAEGFGLPLAELSFFGLPMVVSDLAVFREFAPPQTLFFNPNDLDSLRFALKGIRSHGPVSWIPVTWKDTAVTITNIITNQLRSRHGLD